MMQNYLILENLKFNEQRFNGIVDIDSIKLYYRPLYSCYQLQFTLGCFVNYRRRKETDCIDINKIIVKYNIKIEDILNIPLFIELKKSTTNISVEKQFETLVNNDTDLLQDLLLEYEKNIGEYIYGNNNKNIYIVKERVCGFNDDVKALTLMSNILNISPLPNELKFHQFTIDVY